MIDLLLPLCRTLPATLLAPLPGGIAVRVLLAFVTAWWLEPPHDTSVPLEFLIGASIGATTLLAAEVGKSFGLIARTQLRANLDAWFDALFWVCFFSGPHILWFRAMADATQLTPLATADNAFFLLDRTLATALAAAAPLLLVLAFVHLAQRALETTLGAPQMRSAVPLLAAVTLVVLAPFVADHIHLAANFALFELP